MPFDWSLEEIAAGATAIGVLLAFWQYRHSLPERRLRLLLEVRDSDKSSSRVQALASMLVLQHFRRVFYPERRKFVLWWNLGTMGIGSLLVGVSVVLFLRTWPNVIFAATAAFGAVLVYVGYVGANLIFNMPSDNADKIREGLKEEEEALLAKVVRVS